MDEELHEGDGGVTADVEVEPETTDVPGSVPGFDQSPKKPHPAVWLFMGALVLGALAFGFLRDDVLFEDDFTTPEALRTWPYGETQYDYVDGAYHLTSLGGQPASAYHELPSAVSALSMRVSMETVSGSPIGVFQCASAATVDDLAGTVEISDGYFFAVEPEGGSYVIGYVNDVIDQGELPPATEVIIGCSSDGSTTTLSIEVPGQDAVAVQHEGGSTTFVGIGLGALDPKGTGTIAFDDLKITGA